MKNTHKWGRDKARERYAEGGATFDQRFGRWGRPKDPPLGRNEEYSKGAIHPDAFMEKKHGPGATSPGYELDRKHLYRDPLREYDI